MADYWYIVPIYLIVMLTISGGLYFLAPANLLRLCLIAERNLIVKLTLGEQSLSIPIKYVLVFPFFLLSDRLADTWLSQVREPFQNHFSDSNFMRNRDTHIFGRYVIDGQTIRSMDSLVRMLRDQERPSGVVITGEGGVGKSALAAELMRRMIRGAVNQDLALPVFFRFGQALGDSLDADLGGAVAARVREYVGESRTLPRSFVRKMLRTGRLVPIIDDADRLLGESWAAMVSEDFCTSFFILTCRNPVLIEPRQGLEIRVDRIHRAAVPEFVDRYIETKYATHLQLRAAKGEVITQIEDELGVSDTVPAYFLTRFVDVVASDVSRLTDANRDFSTLGIVQDFIAEVGRQARLNEFELARKYDIFCLLAHESLRNNFVPDPISVDTYEMIARRKGEDTSIDDTLSDYFQILEFVDRTALQFVLDPIAEHLAADYVCSNSDSFPTRLGDLLVRVPDTAPGDPYLGQGFFRAIHSIANARQLLRELPDEHLDSLRRVAGLKERADGLHVVRVGVLFSSSGPTAFRERSLSTLAEEFIREANKELQHYKAIIQPIIRDGRSEPRTYRTHAIKLIKDYRVSCIIGCWTSNARIAVRPIVEEYKNLLFYVATYEGYEKAGRIIYLGATANQQTIPAIEWGVKNLGKRVYFLGSDYEFPRITNAVAEETLIRNGGVVVGTSYIPLGDRSTDRIGGVVDEILELAPDFVFHTVNSSTNVAFAKELKRREISASDVPIITVSISEDTLSEMPPGSMEGQYMCWNYFGALKSDENSRFQTLVQELVGNRHEPDDAIESLYVAVQSIKRAIIEDGANTADDILQSARRLKVEAPSGLREVDRTNNHSPKRCYVARIGTAGRVEIVWRGARIWPNPFPYEELSDHWHNHYTTPHE